MAVPAYGSRSKSRFIASVLTFMRSWRTFQIERFLQQQITLMVRFPTSINIFKDVAACLLHQTCSLAPTISHGTFSLDVQSSHDEELTDARPSAIAERCRKAVLLFFHSVTSLITVLCCNSSDNDLI